MQRSYNAGGAIGVAGLLAFLIAQCGAPNPGTPTDTTSPPSAIAATVPPIVTTTTSSPTTTWPPEPTTTTTDAPTTTIATPPPPATEPTPPAAPAPTTPLTTPVPPPAVAPTTAAPTTAAPTTAAPAPTPPPAPGARPSPDAVTLTNQQRQAAGLPALSTDGALTAASAQHSSDHASRNSMGHTGSDGSSAGDRVRANGGSFGTWGENVAAGDGSAAGVAVATSADGTPYWTMVLGG